MSEPAGPFKVVLQSVDDTFGSSRVRSEVSRLFQIDDETASNIVSAIPIVVLDGLDARTAGVVRERMRPLVNGGCRVVTTDDPMDTIPRVNWPEMPEIARIPAEETRTVVVTTGDAGPPLAAFACPGCGLAFHLHAARPGSPPASAAHAGALVTPGASAPRTGGQPGSGGEHATGHAGANRGTHKAPAKSEAAAAVASAEPGAKLAGDEWLDPPIASKTTARAAATATASPVAAASAAKTETAKPVPAPAKTPEPVEARLAEAKPVETKRPSLLDDPLLAVSTLSPAGPNAPTTLTARPITNRFLRTAAPPPPRLAEAPPQPARAAAPVGPPPPPVTAPPPQPASTTPGRSTDRFSPDASRRASAPPPPPPPAPASKAAAAKDASPATSGLSGVSSSALDEELDVHFDEASDMDAAAKLPARTLDDDDDPSGVGDDAMSLLDEDLDAPKKASSKSSSSDLPSASSKSAPASKKPAPRAGNDDDDLLFDDLDSKDEPKSRSKSDDGSFGAEAIDDLLDVPPPAPVSRGREPAKKGREPKPLPDSDDKHDALFSSDEQPAAKPSKAAAKPSRKDPFASTGQEEEEEETLFGESNDPDAEPKGKKKKAPRESGFEDALGLFEEDDEQPLDDGKGLEPMESVDDDDVPEIQPLDLASDVAGPSGSSKGGGKGKGGSKADPFGDRSSSAILEPLDPNEAMAILKTHKKDDLDGPDEPAGPSGDLEPLDPNEALAILGTDEPERGNKTPPRKPGKQKGGRRSEASKLVPLSASDEDFAFLDDNKAKSKKTDPFARARRDAGSSSSEVPAPKKRGEAPASKGDPATKSNGRGDPARSSKGGGGREAPPAAPAPKPAARGGRVPEGAGECGLVLPRISTESKRQTAAEIIAEIKGLGVDEALKLTERTIIPVLTGVSREVAEFHREKFERAKISARVTTRQKDR